MRKLCNKVKYKKIQIQKDIQYASNLKCWYLNARSIRNKKDTFLAEIKTVQPDIVAVTETWLNTNNKDFVGEYTITGYNLLNHDRLHKRGGGTLLYIKNDIKFVETSKHILNNNYEMIFIDILLNNNKKVVFGVVYRPPKQNELQDIDMFQEISNHIKSNETVIVGDFNYPGINWTTLTGDREGQTCLNFLEDNFLEQIVDKPTRGNNTLDLILSSDTNLIDNFEVGEKFSTSDHQSLSLSINVNTIKSRNNIKVPNFKLANYSKLKKEFLNIDWDSKFLNKNMEEMWTEFRTIFNEKVQLCIPSKVKTVNNSNEDKKWMTHKIKRVINKKNSLYKQFKQTNNPDHERLHKKQQKIVKKTVSSGKRSYEKKLAENSKTNPRQFYGYVGNKKAVKESINVLENDDGTTVTGTQNIAEKLNVYFETVFAAKTNGNNMSTPTASQNIELLSINEVNILNVGKKLSLLNPMKSVGPDNVYPKILQKMHEELKYPITKLFNKSLQTNSIPMEWKKSNVTPIHKSGSKKKASNYRPISITSILCRVLESCIKDEITSHFEKHNLIHDSQHGFRSNKSCLTNLIEFFDAVINVYDQKKPVDVIYLDFAKAFDKVPHNKLISKLKSYYLDCNLIKWIEDWLSNRQQSVVLSGVNSTWKQVTSGVPQGSVLGPLLFISYINDIDVGLTSKIAKFADDTKLMSSVESKAKIEEFKKDIKKLELWSDQNDMPFNVNKCTVMHIGKKNDKFNYKMFDNELSKTEKQKDLGIIITPDLKAAAQVTTACNKANRILGLISRNFSYKTIETVRSLYTALVRPHLEFAVQFWSPHYKKDIAKIEGVQRRATKMVPYLRALSYEERLKKMNLFTMEKRRSRGDLIELFKILKGFDKIRVKDLFEFDTSNITRGHNFKLKKKRFYTDVAKFNFVNRVIDAWNSLPAVVVNSLTIDTFKKKLDHHFLELHVY